MIEEDLFLPTIDAREPSLCPLGIERLDNLLGGGVPCGSTILVEGPPGSRLALPLNLSTRELVGARKVFM